eukprot:scaffold1410_cov386-Prasinococcus_capsulatus_cf.AAC.5
MKTHAHSWGRPQVAIPPGVVSSSDSRRRTRSFPQLPRSGAPERAAPRATVRPGTVRRLRGESRAAPTAAARGQRKKERRRGSRGPDGTAPRRTHQRLMGSAPGCASFPSLDAPPGWVAERGPACAGGFSNRSRTPGAARRRARGDAHEVRLLRGLTGTARRQPDNLPSHSADGRIFTARMATLGASTAGRGASVRGGCVAPVQPAGGPRFEERGSGGRPRRG